MEQEREELLSFNKGEIDSLFDRRRTMELAYMDAKQQREEQYQHEIDELRVKGGEDYNKLKIKLETDIQTLEQQLEEMRATYQLNTEKLEYNFRVLTVRRLCAFGVSVYLPACPPDRLPACLPACLPAFLSICPTYRALCVFRWACKCLSFRLWLFKSAQCGGPQEKDNDNSATRALQKRKLARLNDALSSLKAKYSAVSTSACVAVLGVRH